MAAAEENGGGGVGEGRRREPPPPTLPGLLEMAVVAGEPRPPPREPMDEETQRWLRAALGAALGGGPSAGGGGAQAELRRCLRVLVGPSPHPGKEEELGGPPPEEKGGPGPPHPGEEEEGGEGAQEQALELLAELCEELEHATAFCALGGLGVAVGLLSHPSPPLRGGAARLLGVCTQNLPPAQGAALALGVLPPLLGGVRGDPDPRVPPAAMFAISCLVRAQPRGLQQLEALGGLEVLGGALESPNPPLRARAAFLVHCVLREHPQMRGPLCSLGTVPRLVALLRGGHDGTHEHALGALCSLAECPEGLRECRAPPLGLEQLLRERRGLLRGLEEFQEELEFCEQLLQLCFESPPQGTPPEDTPPEETPMDR